MHSNSKEKMNIDEIRKWHKTFKREGELFEIRVLGDRTWSGYFTDADQVIAQLQPYDNLNIYFTVNEVKRACASRSQFGQFHQVKGTATSKQDIERRWFIPIDVDCERPTGVSSTKEEKELAYRKAGDVFRFLRQNGFSDPIVCDSSSGYHIFVPVDIENTQEAEQSVKTFLETLSRKFSDEKVKIDIVLFDANRIIRLPGTFGRKGRSTKERPHRAAKILYVPDEISRVGLDFIDAFNEKYKIVVEQERRYSGYNGSREEFDIRSFIARHGIGVTKELPMAGGGTKFVLAECPFDSGHKSPDSAIFEFANGAIAFKCFHNSCSQYTWRDVREKFEPGIYERRYEPQKQFNAPSQLQYQQTGRTPIDNSQLTIKPEIPELGKKWFSMKDIQKVNISELEHFKSGFFDLDMATRGLFFSSLTIVSGTNASGKSSWLNTLMLNAIEQGHKCALWSGELRPDVLKIWIQMVAAGRKHLRLSSNGKYWYVPDEISQKIDSWMDGKFYLYNNEYSNRWEQLFADMKELLDAGVRIFFLDNLFSLDIDIFNGDNNTKQKALINQLVEFKKAYKAHIVLVAHPRKTISFIRKNDISGTSAIIDAADYIFIIHRVNQDFRNTVKEVFPLLKFKKNADDECEYSNMIEVAKDRMMGTQDFFCGMYYEMESRRFKNTKDEYIEYGWRDDNGVQSDITFTAAVPSSVQKEDLPFHPSKSGEETPF